MTTGELRAQPKKCTFLPRRAEELLHPLCSVRGVSGTSHQTIPGPRAGCAHPGPGLAQHLPLATLAPPRSRSGEPRSALHILINITDPGTAQTLIPA